MDAENIVEIVRIPRERVEALKGEGDETLRMLEEKLDLKISVDKEGDVEIEGESVNVFFALPVIKAVGRGFEPRIALKLRDDEYGLKVIDLCDYAKNKKQMTRVKGRIIGENGKAKEIIESEAECNLAIYGHTVGIIGRLDVIDVAATAVFKLAEGTPHSGVYFYLEKNKRRRKGEELAGRTGKMWKK
ncbi:MAG: KH domain-containing protein [Candidatus Micrarchaeota archaeon]